MKLKINTKFKLVDQVCIMKSVRVSAQISATRYQYDILMIVSSLIRDIFDGFSMIR
jgi:hypothetical protein